MKWVLGREGGSLSIFCLFFVEDGEEGVEEGLRLPRVGRRKAGGRRSEREEKRAKPKREKKGTRRSPGPRKM